MFGFTAADTQTEEYFSGVVSHQVFFLFAIASWLCLYFKSQAKWLMASLWSWVSFGLFSQEPGEKKNA